MTFGNFKVLKDVSVLENQTEQKGGDYTPPAEGRCQLRLVGYVELGKHKGEYQGKPKVNDKVRLIFEVHGKKWEPTRLENGEIVPVRMSVNLNKSFTSKSGYYKLFLRMRDERTEISHMAQMLGEGFSGDIRHETNKETGKTFATLKDKEGAFTIRPPYRLDEELDEDGQPTGELKKVMLKINDPIGEAKMFLWDNADEEQWASIYIPGEYDGKSKNTLQLEICKAVNFAGSLAEALATESGVLEEARNGVQSASDDGEDEDGDAEGGTTKKTSKSPKDKVPPRDKPNKPEAGAEEQGKTGGVGIADID